MTQKWVLSYEIPDFSASTLRSTYTEETVELQAETPEDAIIEAKAAWVRIRQEKSEDKSYVAMAFPYYPEYPKDPRLSLKVDWE